MNCPNCGAPMRVDANREAAVCDFCESTAFPKPNRDGVRCFGTASERECPVCHVALAKAAAARHPVEYCERCGGMLIGVGDFTEIVDTLRWEGARPVPPPEAVDPEALERTVECPGCRRTMDTHPYAGPGNVVIDNCPRCELNWLDARELDRIVSAPDTQGAWARSGNLGRSTLDDDLVDPTEAVRSDRID